ncbi:MAG: tRNA (adenosine(37)-N6)-dimethylallyltransferase MiaA [Dehalococcoidales bacterium]|nr:tRNA (adenosine(37)-N6)-dimethylallyltransferase MiaA [Dehalococcoidales bacterium]
MNKIIAIIGPTGIGKSQLAIKIAQIFNGEIVGADSRQVYRFMDIGTAKPDSNERTLVPHYLVDIINPHEAFSLAEYQQQCVSTINDIINRQKLPLLVGGSGQYVWSILENWRIPRVTPDLEYRNQLEQRASEKGREDLYHELEIVAPEAAKRIDRSNVRRVIRALEICKNFGDTDNQPYKNNSLYNALIIGLTIDREKLYRRIDSRVDEMIKKGLVREVEKLVRMGYNLDLPSMSGIGYRQIGMFLKGEINLDSAVRQIKFESHRYVRGQYNWFKLKDDRIKWFDIKCDIQSEILELIDNFINQN